MLKGFSLPRMLLIAVLALPLVLSSEFQFGMRHLRSRRGAVGDAIASTSGTGAPSSSAAVQRLLASNSESKQAERVQDSSSDDDSADDETYKQSLLGKPCPAGFDNGELPCTDPSLRSIANPKTKPVRNPVYYEWSAQALTAEAQKQNHHGAARAFGFAVRKGLLQDRLNVHSKDFGIDPETVKLEFYIICKNASQCQMDCWFHDFRRRNDPEGKIKPVKWHTAPDVSGRKQIPRTEFFAVHPSVKQEAISRYMSTKLGPCTFHKA